MLGFLPTRAYRPGTPGATTFLSPLSGTFNYGWDSFENIDAQESVRDGMNKAKTRVLIDLTAVTEISKEARDYFANERTASIQRATALLIGSPVSRVIGNFFMGLNKPISPTRLFTDPHKAIQWLHTFSDD